MISRIWTWTWTWSGVGSWVRPLQHYGHHGHQHETMTTGKIYCFSDEIVDGNFEFFYFLDCFYGESVLGRGRVRDRSLQDNHMW